jgi:hypothetical protein
MDRAIDHQITLDPGGRNSRRLYAAARERAGEPLVGRAAERLLEAIGGDRAAGSDRAKTGDRRAGVDAGDVAIATGFPIPPAAIPETDGPLGAAVLAGALERLGARPVFVVDGRTEPIVAAVADAAGLESMLTIPPAAAADRLAADRLSAVVAIETPGRCADGSHRTMAGEDISSLVDPVDDLVERAGDRGIPTVGVGDGGNEVGMGAIRPAVERHVAGGETIACVTAAESLVVAGVSNWGAYGLVAALADRTGRSLLHTPETERRLLEVAVEAGAIDGVSGRAEPTVDGIDRTVHERVVGVLNALCRD